VYNALFFWGILCPGLGNEKPDNKKNLESIIVE